MNKTEILTSIKIAFAGVFTTITSYLGGYDAALRVLVVLTIIDVITGILSGIYLKELSSSISYKGLIKKIGIYAMAAVACLLDQTLNANSILMTSMIWFYIATEGVSIIENWGKIDLPLPSFIKKVLLQLKEKSDDGNTNENLS